MCLVISTLLISESYSLFLPILVICTFLQFPFVLTHSYLQEAYPQRLKEIHILDAPPFVDWILNVFRSLVKEKMRNRVSLDSPSFFFCNTNRVLARYNADCNKNEEISRQFKIQHMINKIFRPDRSLLSINRMII